MSKLRLVIYILLLLSSIIYGQEDFSRPLPGEDLTSQITPEKFPNSDAVIILKEQSFQETGGEYFYYGVDIPTSNTVYTKIIIVKLLNESAVKRYGNFEYEYAEPYGNEIKNGFYAKVRVKKTDGNVYEMPKENLKILVTDQDKHGNPMRRKALFNVPDLAPGDILQIEYQTLDIFSSSSSGLFFYNDEDIILFSNLYITLPQKNEYVFKSFPADKVGEPKIVQLSSNYGDGETYFWSMRNLFATPSQAFSRPFSDRSLMTCFFMSKKYIGDKGDWNSLTERYFEKILDKGSVSSGQIELLGFRKDEQNVDFNKIDALYSAMRKYFVLDAVSYPYPKLDDIDDVFDEKKGDASDLAYIMYKILEKWDVKSKAVLMRDRRKGTYEKEIPSMIWFNRIGIIVEKDGKEKLYDFDRSLPSIPENPWYLNNVSLPVIDQTPCVHKKFTFDDNPGCNVFAEIHKLSINTNSGLKDSLELSYTGSFAQRLRNQLYSYDKSKITEYFRNTPLSCLMSKPEAIQLNNYHNESKIIASAFGTPQFRTETIDSFLTISLTNIVLKEFRDKLFTTRRSSDIYLDSPCTFLMQYEIPVPADYKLYSKPLDITTSLPEGLRFELDYRVTENKIIITARQSLLNSIYSEKNYKNIMEHLDNSLKEISKDLIFVKSISSNI